VGDVTRREDLWRMDKPDLIDRVQELEAERPDDRLPAGPLILLPLAPVVAELKARITLYNRGVLDLWDAGEWKTYEEALEATKHMPARRP